MEENIKATDNINDNHLCSTVFFLVLGFSWIVFIWETYLAKRQRLLCEKSEKITSELEGIIDQKTFDKARSYQLDRSTFGFWSSLYNQIETTILLWLFAMAFLWRISGDHLAYFGYSKDYEVVHSILFCIYGIIYSTITSLPWGLYSTFVIEERHGFNKQTLGFYLKDLVKKTILSIAIGIPITALLIYIIKIGGDYFFIYAWLFIVFVSLIIVEIYADYIAPLFDKYTPLPEGELRTKIEQLAASIDFPLKKLFVVDGSNRSSHSNAYFYGFFKNKRIVLFDTLIEGYVKPKENKTDEIKIDDDTNKDINKEDIMKDISKEEIEKRPVGCNTEEILAVLSHELGHWKLNHNFKNIFISQINLLCMLLIFGGLIEKQLLYDAFGFMDSRPTLIGLIIIFQYIFSPYNELFSFIMTINSRKFEFQADAFAKKLGYGTPLRSALIKLNKDNLGFPLSDWLYSMFHHSHPPLLERLDVISKTE